MATTDYDTPRLGSVEDPDTDPLDAISTARKEAQSPNVDLDETDIADGIELPGADLSALFGDELTMPVIPKRADEFTCACCFLVQHRRSPDRTAAGCRTTLNSPALANRTAPSIHPWVIAVLVGHPGPW